MAPHPFANAQPAPSLAGGVSWINSAGPIDLEDLRGKFVVLDFWTYCCINCLHILPELKKLERAYPNEVVVIGVHSAKFETEEETDNIREAVERYEIEHPVINDANHVVWDRFGAQSWPTICIIDPEGKLIVRESGEIPFTAFDQFLKKALPYYREHKLLDATPLHFDLAAAQAKQTPLRYPGKILADAAGGRLFISDSNHNRIAIAGLDGALQEVIGSGAIGKQDGDYAQAQFDHPQGMALVGEKLYVADTENHLIRQVDLKSKQVSTIAGVGRQSRGWYHDLTPPEWRGDVKTTALNSPWALWPHDGWLYIAMAGSHQIWRLNLSGSEIELYAGNGREDIVDGDLRPDEPYAAGACSFAQPSGLVGDDKWLYVADSEGSSIRAVPFNAKGRVKTVVGTSHLPQARLFTFGDVDGANPDARLQHALGVTLADGKLYVADTYNHKIKVVDPGKETSTTFAGDGKPGSGDEPTQFHEPCGLSAANGKLYVADTNNHLIRVIDLATKQVSTLEITGLASPSPPAATPAADFANARQVPADAISLKPVDGHVALDLLPSLPLGYKINPLAPLVYRVDIEGDAGPIDAAGVGQLTRADVKELPIRFTIPLTADAGKATLKVGLTYYYCSKEPGGLCKMASVVWTVPTTVSAEAESEAATLNELDLLSP
ncbi:MAG: thioredoxin-like domain-containing protein [Planctomycetia bacterium]|nr:thioredoxin-like domain-containing protein [Planctomycetia bacterium]